MLLVENPEFRQKLSENALKKARTFFDLEKQAKKVEIIYEEVLSTQAEKK